MVGQSYFKQFSLGWLPILAYITFLIMVPVTPLSHLPEPHQLLKWTWRWIAKSSFREPSLAIKLRNCDVLNFCLLGHCRYGCVPKRKCIGHHLHRTMQRLHYGHMEMVLCAPLFRVNPRTLPAFRYDTLLVIWHLQSYIIQEWITTKSYLHYPLKATIQDAKLEPPSVHGCTGKHLLLILATISTAFPPGLWRHFFVHSSSIGVVLYPLAIGTCM